MAWLAIGTGALLLGLWLLRAFATAPPAAIRQALFWLLGLLGAGLFVLLLVSGRGGQAFWALLVFGPMLWRRLRGWAAARRFGRPGEADASTIETATLAMRLDHAAGTLTGRVLRGAEAGRDLAELDLPRLLALLDDCRATDPESLPLLETWLDRAHPGWREAAPPAPDGPMTRAEALAILGLAEGADAAAIRAAHRRLMRTAHPDQGGSDWLATRINQARDLLLG
ncbi:J domain-containing protein [Belnapia rosea]|uniref:J domain-containing protein n=1 Tax=Belnapia rosea TaxID=938405 RepID=A0A1G7BI10_9PROT|nr:hypothetical protein [Belnapia rosea]SDE26704.1 hypothetical protein SAMN04487779_102540 [Belnapia rosea]